MVVVIMGASVLLVWLLYVGLGAVDFDPQWWLSLPSFAGCYSVLHWLFDRYGWGLGLLRKIKFIQVPDLNGKWEGEVESSYSQDARVYQVSVFIMQRWTKILVRLEADRSHSRSISASLRNGDLLNPELSYQYINEPKPNAPSTMEIHRGTATLELVGSTLEGGYYTGRGRGQFGTIKLKRCSCPGLE